ncbi:MAG: hypothetical protein N4A35_06540 [Flavobacteriales bacterium]|jgi:hypothetical protein|nr:hypothetical protein [Flavobacteriales bacterium]
MTEETREISILKRNLRLIKRLVFGKENPPLFLRIIAIASIGWSIVITIAMLGLLFLISFTPDVAVLDDLDMLDHRFYISYIGLHLISIIAVILMWRKKVIGFYSYTLVGVLIPFWNSFFLPVFELNYFLLGVSGLFIALFGLNWRVFNSQKKAA